MTTTTSIAPVIRAGLEHEVLESLVKEIDQVATHLGGRPGPGCLRRARTAVDELCPPLLAHLAEEEETVYPLVFPDEYRLAVDLLILDHEAIRGAVARARAASETARTGHGRDNLEPLRRALIALVTLVRAHHDKESFLFLRLLDDADDERE